MLELALLNTVVLVVLAALPRREAVRPEEGRRKARALLRTTRSGSVPLGAALAARGRRIGCRLADALEPRRLADLRAMAFSVAVVGPVLTIAVLALGAGWSSEGDYRLPAVTGSCVAAEEGTSGEALPAEAVDAAREAEKEIAEALDAARARLAGEASELRRALERLRTVERLRTAEELRTVTAVRALEVTLDAPPAPVRVRT